MEIIKFFNENAGFLGLFAVIAAIIIYFGQKYDSTRSNWRKKINLLRAIKTSLEWESGLLHDIYEDEAEDLAKYYDPTRANFKQSNDVLRYAITEAQSDLLFSEKIYLSMVRANDALEYYNQQVQEQHDFRFSDPGLLGIATSESKGGNSEILKEWMCNRENRPEKLKDFLEELRLRNWAINSGKLHRLRPALSDLYAQIDGEISRLKRKKFWPFGL